jgi:hypothetical protein
MGQWAVSVLGLEPLHLTVTLTFADALATGLSDLASREGTRARG